MNSNEILSGLKLEKTRRVDNVVPSSHNESHQTHYCTFIPDGPHYNFNVI